MVPRFSPSVVRRLPLSTIVAIRRRSSCCLIMSAVSYLGLVNMNHDLRCAFPYLLLQLGYMISTHPAYESNGRTVPFAVLINLKGHARPVGRFTPHRMAISGPLAIS